MELDGGHSLAVPSASILEAHGEGAAGQDTGVDASDGLVVDLGDVVDEIILLMHLFEGALKDEPDEFRDLVQHVLTGVSNAVPHDKVASHRLEQNVVRVALLDGRETVGDRDLIGQFLVV